MCLASLSQFIALVLAVVLQSLHLSLDLGKEYFILYLMLRLSLFHFFCQLYNYFEDANYVYLILEMCHNKEINRYLKKTGRPVGENEGTVHL